MKNNFCAIVLAASLLLPTVHIQGQPTKAAAKPLNVNSLDNFEIVKALAKAPADITKHHGRTALHLVQVTDQGSTGDPAHHALAIFKGSDFKDGAIEADVMGMPRQGAAPDIRGFLGIAFRVQPHGEKYECFHVRILNGRAEDQFRRNHTTQYTSYPEFPWDRLRKENPGVYESYVDVDPAAWTHIKVVVAGTKAQLYVNGADQPALIVNDLRLGEGRGQIGLWVGTDSEGYFSNVKVTSSP